MDSVESGLIAPLRGTYLIALSRLKRAGKPASEWQLLPRHKLPSRAYWTHGELLDVLSRLVSCQWGGEGGGERESEVPCC